jgi:hypothetical protein
VAIFEIKDFPGLIIYVSLYCLNQLSNYSDQQYYEKKMKEFFELKLGNMTIDEYERRFLELLKYVSFIKNETIKIQRYLSGFSSFISDKIQYDDPNTLDETIR